MAAKLYRAGDRGRVAKVDFPSDSPERYRSPWRQDYARLLHSAAFRRLQGKTQLFPGHESDFFRNRLTHSLEVAQIAKSIAMRLNHTEKFLKSAQRKIDTDLVEVAALAHDLGHPPFGHNGEEALDACMKDWGGFEGNAQTLRILSKLEKKQTKSYDKNQPIPVLKGVDNRAGLNLTYRTLAAVLKYDNEIPREDKDRLQPGKVVKGYYYTEADIVKDIKQKVGQNSGEKFKTLECSIMDIADDIAYSTYDLEDSFKAGFLTPLKMLSAPIEIVERVAATVKYRLDTYYKSADDRDKKFSVEDVYTILVDLFSDLFRVSEEDVKKISEEDFDIIGFAARITNRSSGRSAKLTSSGYSRTQLTSELVGKFIRGVKLIPNEEYPALSTVSLDINLFKQVEVLKNFAYQSLIMSSMLKVAEHRGKDIVTKIFEALTDDHGHLLMPDDFRDLYSDLKEPHEKKRVACDFIAGMTDRYAIQFYSRLYSTNPESIYSPI